jgi:hypothetical protein
MGRVWNDIWLRGIIQPRPLLVHRTERGWSGAMGIGTGVDDVEKWAVFVVLFSLTSKK